jgi:hypothetical protein
MFSLLFESPFFFPGPFFLPAHLLLLPGVRLGIQAFVGLSLRVLKQITADGLCVARELAGIGCIIRSD